MKLVSIAHTKRIDLLYHKERMEEVYKRYDNFLLAPLLSSHVYVKMQCAWFVSVLQNSNVIFHFKNGGMFNFTPSKSKSSSISKPRSAIMDPHSAVMPKALIA